MCIKNHTYETNTMKPLSTISEGTVENKQRMHENDSCRKAL
jgi:hypothetical protein